MEAIVFINAEIHRFAGMNNEMSIKEMASEMKLFYEKLRNLTVKNPNLTDAQIKEIRSTVSNLSHLPYFERENHIILLATYINSCA